MTMKITRQKEICLKVETVERRIKDNLWAICVTGSSPEETKTETNVNDVLVSQKIHQRLQTIVCASRTTRPYGRIRLLVGSVTPQGTLARR